MLRIFLHRAPSAAIMLFAAWTLLAESTVALGGSLIGLEIASVMVFVLAAVTGGLVRARRVPAIEPPPPAFTEPAATRAQSQRFVLVLLCAICAVLLYRATGRVDVLGAGGAVLLLGGLVWRWREQDDGPAPSTPRSTLGALALLALALLTAAIALVAHNPDPDDAFYLNVAAQAATAPHAPLLVHDGIFGIEGMPIQLPVYRAHSIELGVGMIAHLTGLEPIVVAHVGLVALAGFFVPLVAARLLHRLVPGAAVLGALVCVVVLLACGEGELGPGHFSLLRLQQGKGLLVALALPMLFDALLAYAQAPSRASWLRFFAVQVAAVGFTSSALFVVPLTSAITLLVVWRWGRERQRALWAGLLASAHTGMVLLWLGPPMAEQVELMDALTGDPSATSANGIATSTLHRALGDSNWTAILLVTVLCAWAVPRRAMVGRALAGSALLVFGLFLQPSFATWAAERLLAPDVYFRVLWMVPWGVASAVAFTAPLHLGLQQPFARRALSVGTAAMALGLPLLTTPTTVLQERAQTRVARPGLKVPPLEYEAARWLAHHTPPGSPVLAAIDVAPWVSTFRSQPHPVYSRLIYHRYLQLGLPDEEVDQRRTLAGYVSFRGPHLDRTDVLCHHADARNLRGIALRRFDVRTGAQLAACGFRRVGRNELYDVWVRDEE